MFENNIAREELADYAPHIGTAQHYRWLGGVVGAVLILNLIDAVLTILVVRAGYAREANPLLAHLLEGNPVGFAMVKMALVSSGTYLLWKHRRHRAAVCSIFIAFIAYYAVIVHHLSAWDMPMIKHLIW